MGDYYYYDDVVVVVIVVIVVEGGKKFENEIERDYASLLCPELNHINDCDPSSVSFQYHIF